MVVMAEEERILFLGVMLTFGHCFTFVTLRMYWQKMVQMEAKATVQVKMVMIFIWMYH